MSRFSDSYYGFQYGIGPQGSDRCKAFFSFVLVLTPFNIFLLFFCLFCVEERKIYLNKDLIAENRRLKEALAACNGILELRDAALAAAEAMGLTYEVLGLVSAGLTFLLAIIRAIWVHYRGTPFVVDRIDQLTIFISFYFSVSFFNVISIYRFTRSKVIHALFL